MKNFPISPRRERSIVSGLTLLAILVGQFIYTTSRSSVAGQGRADASLHAAVASKSEAELQRIESSYANTPEAALARFMRGYLRLQARDFQAAASLLSDAKIAQLTAIGDYALYYRGQALQEGGNGNDAEREYRRLAREYPASLLARTAILQAAGSALLRGDHQAVIDGVAPLTDKNDGAALKLRADALEKMGRTNEAIIMLRKLYFDAPQSPEAEKVGARLAALGGSTAPADATQLKRRADSLYNAGLYAIAAQAYDLIPRTFPAEVTDEVWFFTGLSYYRANQFRPAADALARVRARTPKLMADSFYYLGLAQLSMQNEPAALQTLASLRRAAPGSDRIGALLYDLGRHHEKRNSNEQAAAYYSQVVRQFPQSEKADEAHFFLAWRAHQARDYATASRLLTEHVANYGGVTENRGKAGFWAALDSDRAGHRGRALALFRAMLMRYGAGWFGVNSERRIQQMEREGVRTTAADADVLLRRAIEGLQTINLPQETLNATDAGRVRRAEDLMRIAFYSSASNELDAARTSAPNSPLVNLRIAQIFRAQGEPVAAINALKRSYPDYGQTLPEEMSRECWDIFYPLRWWPNIKEESARHGLDPYFIAGLIRQETVFDPKARSRANALGLMQLLPSTGQSVARRTRGGGITSNDLFNPVLNIQLGTAYVKEMLDRFGRFEYVAAAYNGGPTRVSRWTKELPTAEIEEWVEAIPLSETRAYVQGVYRNSRQYQRLYDEQGRFRSNVPQ
ncbi:MAG: transglycosylase SLT domain-containing protein [Blastocatellia bacterium]